MFFAFEEVKETNLDFYKEKYIHKLKFIFAKYDISIR